MESWITGAFACGNSVKGWDFDKVGAFFPTSLARNVTTSGN